MSETFYVTTPIYYVNAEPHIGHAYTTIVADVLVRYHRMLGEDTFLLTGTDEHGDKIVRAARNAGEDPKSYVDRVSLLFRGTWPELNIHPSKFIRTTDPEHQAVVQRILQDVYDKGDIYFADYGGLYCFGCERFYTEREHMDGKCPDHRTELEYIKEENYFFRMSAYQDWLIRKIQADPDLIQPERYRNEVLSFLKDPLEDLCISRPKSRLQWGIPLPFDHRFVTYVWFDALINYISALGYPEGELFRRYWPHSHHLIAKDILKPHAIYWPCMLQSAGIRSFSSLHVHGYWNINETKMSKSLGNVREPLKLKDIYGLDAFRYFLMREMVFGLDANFSEESLVQRINADLANDLGNLFSRSAGMLGKYFESIVPRAGSFEPQDEAVCNHTDRIRIQYRRDMDQFGFHKALIGVWEYINHINRYIDQEAPWELHKSERTDRLSTVLAVIFGAVNFVSMLVHPFIPGSSEEMRRRMGLKPEPDPGEPFHADFRDLIPENHRVEKAQSLFPRFELPEIPAVAHAAPVEASPAGEIKPLVSFEEFDKLDLRVGMIRNAEPVPGSRKLFKLEIDVGDVRTVVAGIAPYYGIDELIGRKVIVAANLKPVKRMGIESAGMVLAAAHGDRVFLLSAEDETTPGDRIS